MPDIIQLLPDSIANQIAAGEVVQRPASVVKELMENSIDAGASRVQLVVKDAGKALIQVIDDGSGMSETDARMSLERHATSKIRTADDLFRLRTMGFRGEALASIAAVSHLEMKTGRGNGELGTLLLVEGSEVRRQEAVAIDKGTSVSVRNLFYNIPARRNFLKSNPVEMRHMIDEFQRLALAHPTLSFSLIQGDEVVFDLPPGKLSQRIVGIFGKTYQQQLAPVREETEMIRITGYIGRPESARKTRGEQFLFVNNRFIRSNYLAHAVANAFEGLIQAASFPFYVLFIEIDPRHIDVNVHPTKTEIKFDDERSVYAVISAAVRQALGAHNFAPAIDFSADVNIAVKLDERDAVARRQYFEEQFGAMSRTNLQNWEKLFDDEALVQSRLMPSSHEATVSQESGGRHVVPGAVPTGEKISFQLLDKYLVKVVSRGLVIIDQSAAHERVLYERFLQQLRSNESGSQQSLFPEPITLGAADFAMVMEMSREMHALGFQYEVFGKNTLLVTGVPMGMAGNEKGIFEGLIEQFKINQSELRVPMHESLARALAKRAAIPPGRKLVREEIDSVIGGLFACVNPNFSPDGSPTFFTFDASNLESYFS